MTLGSKQPLSPLPTSSIFDRQTTRSRPSVSQRKIFLRYDLPAIKQAKYLRPEFFPELDRLNEKSSKASRTSFVAMGNTACWALLRTTNISSIRGTATSSNSFGLLNQKILPTYHPAGVLYQWTWRPIVVADLMKAFRESTSQDCAHTGRSLSAHNQGIVRLD